MSLLHVYNYAHDISTITLINFVDLYLIHAVDVFVFPFII